MRNESQILIARAVRSFSLASSKLIILIEPLSCLFQLFAFNQRVYHRKETCYLRTFP